MCLLYAFSLGIWGHLYWTEEGSESGARICRQGLHLRLCTRDASEMDCVWL